MLVCCDFKSDPFKPSCVFYLLLRHAADMSIFRNFMTYTLLHVRHMCAHVPVCVHIHVGCSTTYAYAYTESRGQGQVSVSFSLLFIAF